MLTESFPFNYVKIQIIFNLSRFHSWLNALYNPFMWKVHSRLTTLIVSHDISLDNMKSGLVIYTTSVNIGFSVTHIPIYIAVTLVVFPVCYVMCTWYNLLMIKWKSKKITISEQFQNQKPLFWLGTDTSIRIGSCKLVIGSKLNLLS